MGVLLQSGIPTTNSYGGSTTPPTFLPFPEPCIRQVIWGGGEDREAKEQGTAQQTFSELGNKFTRIHISLHPSASKVTKKQKAKVVASGSPAWSLAIERWVGEACTHGYCQAEGSPSHLGLGLRGFIHWCGPAKLQDFLRSRGVSHKEGY